MANILFKTKSQTAIKYWLIKTPKKTVVQRVTFTGADWNEICKQHSTNLNLLALFLRPMWHANSLIDTPHYFPSVLQWPELNIPVLE